MRHALSIVGYGYLAEDALAGAPKLDLALLERTLRRGLSDVTRLFMHAAKLALDDAGGTADTMHVIFASAFGEIGTAEALLTAAYDDDASSPARFRHSVHNTAPGLLSISAKSHLPSTAVAGGWDTVAMALLEASAQLAADATPVLLVFAEERVPSAISDEHAHGPLAAALVLAREGVGRRGALSHPRRDTSADASLEPLDHPLGGVLSLMQALEQGAARKVVLGPGPAPWCVDVDAQVSA